MTTATKPFPRWLLLSGLVCLLCFLFIEQLPFRVGIDPQAKRCMPSTIYLLDMRTWHPQTGDIVSYRTHGLEPWVKDGTIFTKLIFAKPGDVVQVNQHEVTNGEKNLEIDLSEHVLSKIGLSSAAARREWRLGPDEYFLVGTLPNAFDSRYTGPVKRSQIMAKALPLW